LAVFNQVEEGKGKCLFDALPFGGELNFEKMLLGYYQLTK